MEKLELKHIAPYLPYKLKAIKGVTRIELTSIDLELPLIFHTSYLGSRLKVMSNIADIKPILHPLSDLTQEIEHNGERFVPAKKYGLTMYEGQWCDEYYAEYSESPRAYVPIDGFNFWLFEYHFDVFGLIDKGLAIRKEK